MNYLIGYRDNSRKIHYYLGVNGATGRAVVGPKKEAPRFDHDTGGGNSPPAPGRRRSRRLADGRGGAAMQVCVRAVA